MSVLGIMMIANIDWTNDLVSGVLGVVSLFMGLVLIIQGWRCSRKPYLEKHHNG